MSKVMYCEENCEWYSEGSSRQYEDGGYELWIHKPTQKIIRVPIETVQVWDEAEVEEEQ